ncbi:MAG: hypothetical protein J6T74_06465 [Clostridia bacterium]|nr:hypothetical protein [Clostridia bacterium]
MENNQNAILQRVLMQDKSVQPDKILPVLKSDLRDVLREYGELNGDINVEIDEIENKYCLVMVASFDRFKM